MTKIYSDIQSLLIDLGLNSEISNPLIHVLKIEDEFPNRPMDFAPSKLDFFEFAFSYGHDIDLKVGANSFNPKSGAVNVISPYQLSSWRFRSYSDDSEGYVVYFKPELLQRFNNRQEVLSQYLFYQFHTSPLILLEENQQFEIVNLLRLFLKSFKQNPENDILNSAYLAILLESLKSFDQTKELKRIFANRAEEISYSFERLLNEGVDYRKRLSFYADQLNISGNYMAEAIKSVTGRNPQSLIQEYLVLRAKEHLFQRNETIEVVAEELGFDDVSNFVKYFKKVTGQTPAQFRKARV